MLTCPHTSRDNQKELLWRVRNKKGGACMADGLDGEEDKRWAEPTQNQRRKVKAGKRKGGDTAKAIVRMAKVSME